jgi:hypothetical protein
MGLRPTRCWVLFSFACALSAGCGDESVGGPDAAPADAATDAVALDAAHFRFYNKANSTVTRPCTAFNTSGVALTTP